MLKFIEQTKDVKHILVEKTDRLYRNLTNYSRIDQSEHIIHLVKENEILSKDSKSHAKFIHGIKALMAKNYSDNLSEEVKKGQTEKAEQGHFPTVAPYGYKNNLETRLIQVEQNESILIKRAFELYLTQEFSFATLRDKLFKEGFRYSPSQPRVPLTTIERMLQNPMKSKKKSIFTIIVLIADVHAKIKIRVKKKLRPNLKKF
jgi:site-specific DNA recombinase